MVTCSWGRRASLAVIGLLVVTGVGAASLGGPTADLAAPELMKEEWITTCTTITDPGRYMLVADIRNDRQTHLSESCIRIASDDVILDGAGHTVDGRGISGTIGVAVTSEQELTNVTVSRLTVSDWDWGIYYAGVSGGAVRNVTARHNGAGVSMEETQRVTIRDSEISENGLGVFVYNGSENTIRGSNITANIQNLACDGPSTEVCRNNGSVATATP